MRRAISPVALTWLLVACGATAEPTQPTQGSSPSAPATSAPAPAPTSPPLGATCMRDEIAGVALVTDLRPSSDVCEDAVEVYFDFTPTAPGAREGYRFPDDTDTHRPLDRGALSRACLLGLGIDVGKSVPAHRSEVNEGPCPPVAFSFDVDVSPCSTPCAR